MVIFLTSMVAAIAADTATCMHGLSGWTKIWYLNSVEVRAIEDRIAANDVRPPDYTRLPQNGFLYVEVYRAELSRIPQELVVLRGEEEILREPLREARFWQFGSRPVGVPEDRLLYRAVVPDGTDQMTVFVVDKVLGKRCRAWLDPIAGTMVREKE